MFPVLKVKNKKSKLIIDPVSGIWHLVSYFSPLLLLLIILSLLYSCDRREEVVLSGHTMGTTYRVKVVAGYFQATAGLQEKIDKRLADINQSMSTYLNQSEISRFNRFGKTGEKFVVSEDFIRVMQVAEKVYTASEGAWDGTLGPIVNLWGFGAKGRKARVPHSEDILQQLKNVGFHRLIRVDGRYLIKSNPLVTLDFASIAKGYGVDQVAEVIRASGFNNYLVEIGGEVFASGVRIDGEPWRIGVNTPRKDASIQQVFKVATLKNRAMATSGDYRNFFEIDGKRYSHVIDPRNGYPVANGVVSVSITAESCTFADGLATAVMVMGPEKGLALVNQLEQVEGLIIVDDGGTLVKYASDNF